MINPGPVYSKLILSKSVFHPLISTNCKLPGHLTLCLSICKNCIQEVIASSALRPRNAPSGNTVGWLVNFIGPTGWPSSQYRRVGRRNGIGLMPWFDSERSRPTSL